MYVCLCNAITDKDVRSAVAAGCQSMRDLCQTLGIAGQCGRCVPHAYELLRESIASHPANHARFRAAEVLSRR